MAIPNLAKIKEDFDKVIAYSQGVENPKTDRLFDVWLECKRDFIEAFGGNYIYEFPEKVAFELGEKEKHNRVIRFAGLVESQWGYSELAHFIEDQEPGFFQNLTVADYKSLDGKIIKKGTKLVRAFKHFIHNDRSLADVQNEASRIIQEDKIEGTLCLSVHPLDFLSLSENNHNWRSCHALDGEYRAGNLSYMMDKSTVICYLKSDNDEKLPSFPDNVSWNSKKWRILLYFSNHWEMIMAGRQYPFETSVGIDFVLKNLLPKANLISEDYRRGWSDWNNLLLTKVSLNNNIEVNFDTPYIPIGNGLKPLDEVVENGVGAKQFNDVLSSSCYSPIYAFKYSKYLWGNQLTGGMPLTDESTHFTIGGYTYCLQCGEEEVIEGAETMMCERCELEYGTAVNDMFGYCDCCGRHAFAEDLYIVDDQYVCEACYDSQCSTCEHCGYTTFNENIVYDEETEQYVCKDCLDKIKEGEL